MVVHELQTAYHLAPKELPGFDNQYYFRHVMIDEGKLKFTGTCTGQYVYGTFNY